MYLFGGDRPWDASLFTASDDRVRGGKSQSYLTVLTDPENPENPENPGSRADFSGHLDITALGGAGFASQRSLDDVPGPTWDFSAYDALVLDVARSDGKKYTVTLKDEVLPKRPDGRDQSTISWEYDFVVGPAGGYHNERTGSDRVVVVVPFRDLRPTYRGREKPDAKPLDLKNVRRFSFMIRSFFGEQEGDFSIVFNSVSVGNKDDVPAHSVDPVMAAKSAQDESYQEEVSRAA